MEQQMKVEVKNVKIAQFASEETLCFEATLYADGQRVAVVSNDGHGGPNRYHPVSREKRDLLARVEAYAKTLPPVDMSAYGLDTPLDYDIDLLVNDLIEKFEEAKRLKKWSKKSTVFRLPDDQKGAWRTVNAPYSDEVKAWILKKYPNAEIIDPKTL